MGQQTAAVKVTRVVVMINALSEYTQSVKLCSTKEDPGSAIVVFNRSKSWRTIFAGISRRHLEKSSLKSDFTYFSFLDWGLKYVIIAKSECQKKRITLNLLYKVVEKIIKTRNKRRIVGEDLDL